jgi:hypothetical protein
MLCAALAVPSLALAQEEAAGPNMGAIQLKAGSDVVTEYNLRGINIEDQGFIFQPWLDLIVAVYEGENIPGVEGIALKVGTWGSFQNASVNTIGHPAWFEQDIYGGVELDLAWDLTGTVVYLYRHDPEFPGNYAEEVDMTLAYDDSALWEGKLDIPGFKGLQPHVLVAIETDGAVDGTGNGGDVYYEIGIEPSVCVVQSEDWPVTLSIPMTVGFGSDYYEYINPTTGALEDDSYGYFSVGLVGSVPLKFMPAEYGMWEAHAGVTFMFLGDGAEALTNNNQLDDTEIIGTAGVSMSY